MPPRFQIPFGFVVYLCPEEYLLFMKILIVEDEPSLREIMVQTLRREQYVVEQASDYASALEKIAGYDYDCILLDIMLPGGSGIDSSQVDEKAFDRIEAMIYSMTKEEREKPSIINPKRKRRIAAGSGTTVADVNKLLKQFEMMQKMMKQFKKSPKGFARRLGGMMGNPNAFRGLK